MEYAHDPSRKRGELPGIDDQREVDVSSRIASVCVPG